MNVHKCVLNCEEWLYVPEETIPIIHQMLLRSQIQKRQGHTVLICCGQTGLPVQARAMRPSSVRPEQELLGQIETRGGQRRCPENVCTVNAGTMLQLAASWTHPCRRTAAINPGRRAQGSKVGPWGEGRLVSQVGL